MNHLIIFFVVLWIASGVLSYGLLYPFFRHVSMDNPEIEPNDHTGALFLSFGGPLSLIVALVLSEYACHGLKWRRNRFPA